MLREGTTAATLAGEGGREICGWPEAGVTVSTAKGVLSIGAGAVVASGPSRSSQPPRPPLLDPVPGPSVPAPLEGAEATRQLAPTRRIRRLLGPRFQCPYAASHALSDLDVQIRDARASVGVVFRILNGRVIATVHKPQEVAGALYVQLNRDGGLGWRRGGVDEELGSGGILDRVGGRGSGSGRGRGSIGKRFLSRIPSEGFQASLRGGMDGDGELTAVPGAGAGMAARWARVCRPDIGAGPDGTCSTINMQAS